MVLKVELGLDIIKTTAGKGIHKEVTGTSTPEKRALCPLFASALPSEGSSEQSRASHIQASGHLLEGFLKDFWGTSLVVWRLRLCAPNAGTRVQSLVRELDPTCREEEQRFHELQLRPCTAKQINIIFLIKKTTRFLSPTPSLSVFPPPCPLQMQRGSFTNEFYPNSTRELRGVSEALFVISCF